MMEAPSTHAGTVSSEYPFYIECLLPTPLMHVMIHPRVSLSMAIFADSASRRYHLGESSPIEMEGMYGTRYRIWRIRL